MFYFKNREKNKSKYKLRDKVRYIKKRQKIRDGARIYYSNNREKIILKAKRYYLKNKQKIQKMVDRASALELELVWIPKIMAKQTEVEVRAGQTIEHNLVGLSGVDGRFITDIYKGIHELGMLAKYGAGTSQNFSNLRPIGSDISTGGTSNSVMDWIELYADMMSKTNQNRARRGFLTAYLSVDHPEINEFLDIGTHRMPSDKQRFFQTITTAVTLPIGWRQSLKDGDKEKRKIWAKILKTRKEVGFPYILDLENSNANRPQWYVDRDLYIETSNICIETNEIVSKEKTFACCLSSNNAYYFDEWENHPNFIFDMNLMLDCVIEEYIEKGSKLPGLEKAIKFAKEHRSIGLGILSFHSYLQKKSVVFGDLASYGINHKIFSKLREESDRASMWMAKHFGEPEMLKGYGYRNTTRLAQAPTKSTSYIMGGKILNLSEGVEPHKSNYSSKKLAKIQSEVKNFELVKLLESLGKNSRETWQSILLHNGSVQHLDFLTEKDKAVFCSEYQ